MKKRQITKEEIERFFGSIEVYIKYQNTEISIFKNDLFIANSSEKLSDLFTGNVLKMSINNNLIDTLLIKFKTDLIKTLETQIKRIEKNIKFCETLIKD